MIRTVVVGSKQTANNCLRELVLKHCPQIMLIGEFENTTGARGAIEAMDPQLVFMDIDAPEIGSFELLENYRRLSFELIFLTAFETLALKAIRIAAGDYVPKPLEADDIIAAVGRATRRIASKEEGGYLKAILANIKGTDSSRKIALPTLYGMIFIKVADIVRCRAEGAYTWFYTTSHSELLVTKNLGEYEELLGERDFMRVHHGHLVNLHHIDEFKKGNSPTIVMSDGSTVVVAQRKKDLLLNQLQAALS